MSLVFGGIGRERRRKGKENRQNESRHRILIIIEVTQRGWDGDEEIYQE